MYETQDTNIRNTFYVGGALMGLILFALILSYGAYALVGAYTSSPGALPATFVKPDKLPPPPRVQSDPHADLLRLRAMEDSILLTYGWVDRDSALVRIPVSRAMSLLIERGVPSVEKSMPEHPREHTP